VIVVGFNSGGWGGTPGSGGGGASHAGGLNLLLEAPPVLVTPSPARDAEATSAAATANVFLFAWRFMSVRVLSGRRGHGPQSVREV
jgi:hypothetical protein